MFCKQLTAVQKLINTSHFHPKPVNDSLSKGVFELFVDQLDENRRYLLQSDYNGFKDDEYKIDDYLVSNTCDFIDKYSKTLKKRIIDSRHILETLKNEPFDYSGKDTLYFTPNNDHGYFKNEAHAKRYWSKRIRYLIIYKLIEEDSAFTDIKNNFKTLEAALKPKIIDNQLCLLEEALHANVGLETYVQETFLNALLNYEDPNSSFFNDSEKTEFEGNLANNQLTFGINTNKNSDGEIVIAYIVPGSAAFKNGNFEENDVIKSLTSGKSKMETFCVSNDDILSFINDEKHQTVTFKIKKSDGTVEDIELTKTIAKVEDNTIRGYVLQNKEDFGYIKIPSFYTDMESPNGLGLANDVAKELYKLNQEKIKGLVIDLRFNGGGSMKEAAELSGMFIDRGPLSIIKYPNGDTYTIRDMNRGSLFIKPIVVLINNYSASASEFFASVMQDYSRAIIVGSPSHGKSSAQVIIPLSETEDLGFCKLTVEKFYRITGLSHQSVGVIPDVELPSIYDNFKTSERFEKFALSNDSVQVSMKYHRFKPFPLQLINANSLKRVENNSSFKAIKNINNSVLNDYINKTSEYPLTLDNIYNDLKGYNMLWSAFYSQMDAQTSSISVRNTASTDEILQYNQDDLQANEEILDDIANDIYIEEAYTILLDLITSKTNN
ncbi:MAG: S41 family peptidase [Gelidibacter sp.]